MAARTESQSRKPYFLMTASSYIGFVSVSYTHLDVYKRQLFYCLFLSLRLNLKTKLFQLYCVNR